MSRETRDRITHRAAALAVPLPSELLDRLVAYYDLLFRWNETINLTALGDSDEAVDKMILEPVIAATHLPARGRLMDVGSGGGSPAVPLALASSAPSLLMVESRGRKASFLREVVRQLDLPAQVEGARLENLIERDDLRASFEVVSMRAVRPDVSFLGLLATFLREHGRLALFTGPAGLPLPERLKLLSHVRLVPQLHSMLLTATMEP